MHQHVLSASPGEPNTITLVRMGRHDKRIIVSRFVHVANPTRSHMHQVQENIIAHGCRANVCRTSVSPCCQAVGDPDGICARQSQANPNRTSRQIDCVIPLVLRQRAAHFSHNSATRRSPGPNVAEVRHSCSLGVGRSIHVVDLTRFYFHQLRENIIVHACRANVCCTPGPQCHQVVGEPGSMYSHQFYANPCRTFRQIDCEILIVSGQRLAHFHNMSQPEFGQTLVQPWGTLVLSQGSRQAHI